MNDNAVDIISEAYDRMKNIGHRTVWFSGEATLEGETTEVFFFYTHKKETAQKAATALNAADVLCGTSLGTI